MRVSFTRPNKSGAKLQKKIDIRKENVEKHKIFSDFYKKREFARLSAQHKQSGKLATEFTAWMGEEDRSWAIRYFPQGSR